MKKQDHEEAMRRISFELQAFGSDSIFNKKASAVRNRIEELEAKLQALKGQERRSA